MTDTKNTSTAPAGIDVDKETWITRATAKLQPYEFENARAYAESLYETYVIECGDWADDPEGAVEEDMSYWGD
jgi:hypothetical protein